MAVVDAYVDGNIRTSGFGVSKLLKSAQAHGAQLWAFAATVELAAGDDDGSKYRFFYGLPPNLVPYEIRVGCDTITAGTDFDLGLYRTNLGAVLVKDCLMDGQTLATAAKLGSAQALPGMGIVDIAVVPGKRLFEYAGHTVKNKLAAYDMVLTANTVGSAAGTVSIIMLAFQG